MKQRLFMNTGARRARADHQDIDRSRIERSQQLDGQTALQVEDMLRLGRQLDQQIDITAALRIVQSRPEQAYPRLGAARFGDDPQNRLSMLSAEPHGDLGATDAGPKSKPGRSVREWWQGHGGVVNDR